METPALSRRKIADNLLYIVCFRVLQDSKVWFLFFFFSLKRPILGFVSCLLSPSFFPLYSFSRLKVIALKSSDRFHPHTFHLIYCIFTRPIERDRRTCGHTDKVGWSRPGHWANSYPREHAWILPEYTWMMNFSNLLSSSILCFFLNFSFSWREILFHLRLRIGFARKWSTLLQADEQQSAVPGWRLLHQLGKLI